MAKLRTAMEGALEEGGEGGELLKMLASDQRQTTMELYRKNAEIKVHSSFPPPLPQVLVRGCTLWLTECLVINQGH
jgi:hypothetical protein